MSPNAERPNAEGRPGVDSGGAGRKVRSGAFVAAAGVALLFAALFTVPIDGFERRSGESVEVPAGEVVADDLYVVGDTVTISGVVQGDLIAVARHIRLLGTVEGDAMLAGQAVEIEGTVGDDARLAGQFVRIASSAAIGDDLMAAGFSLETEAGSLVGGALNWAGYQAELAGEVVGDAELSSDAVELLGRVGGNVKAQVGGGGGPSPMMFMPSAPISGPSVTSGLSLGESAVISGDLEYTARQEARVADRAIVGGESNWSEPARSPEEDSPAEPWWVSLLRRFAELAVLGLLLALLLPGWLGRRSDQARARPFPTLGWGAVGLFGMSIAALLALVVGVVLAIIFGNLGASGLATLSVVGGMVTSAGLTLSLVASWAYLGPVVAAAVVGAVVLRQRGARRGGLTLAVLLGVLVYVLLRAIPFVGWISGLILTLLGFGAIFRWCLARMQRRFRPGSDSGDSPGEIATPA